jgi:hypothetical protein
VNKIPSLPSVLSAALPFNGSWLTVCTLLLSAALSALSVAGDADGKADGDASPTVRRKLLRSFVADEADGGDGALPSLTG